MACSRMLSSEWSPTLGRYDVNDFLQVSYTTTIMQDSQNEFESFIASLTACNLGINKNKWFPATEPLVYWQGTFRRMQLYSKNLGCVLPHIFVYRILIEPVLFNIHKRDQNVWQMHIKILIIASPTMWKPPPSKISVWHWCCNIADGFASIVSLASSIIK